MTYVFQYLTPNKNRDYESYAHHLLLLFYTFGDESHLVVGVPPTTIHKIFKTNSSFHVKQSTTGKV